MEHAALAHAAWTPNQPPAVLVQMAGAAAGAAVRAETSAPSEAAGLFVAEAMAEVLAAPSAAAACAALANTFQRRTSAALVAVGLQENGTCRVGGISGVRQFDTQSELVRSLEAVLQEAADRRFAASAAAGGQGVAGTLPQKRLLALLEAGHLFSAPLVDRQGRSIGAWLFVGRKPLSGGSDPAVLLVPAEPCIAAALAARPTAEASVRTRRWPKLAARWLVALAVVAVLAVPMPYRVGCSCELQPVLRRYIAAPFEGRLQQVLVEAGDPVKAGQTLARLDGREIQVELAGLKADHNRARKARDAGLAAGDVAAAQMSGLEMERLGLKIKLLEERIQRLEVTSPIDGLVISGDLKRTEGAPLVRGQTLFEIAPLERLVCEVLVPDDEIGRVALGQPVTARLDSCPQRPIAATVARIHPRAEIRDGVNVFVAEFALDNPDGALRPGMVGAASVSTATGPLGWNLFHRAFERSAGWLAFYFGSE